jgi:hypothetical protein
MAVNLALLAGQAGLGPGCYILGKNASDISRRHKLPGGKPPRVGDVVQVEKMPFVIFPAPLLKKCLWVHHQPGAKRHLGKKQW